MRIAHIILPVTVPALLALAACGSDPRPTQVIIQQPAPVVTPTAPMPPPRPMSELVPPPPVSASPTVWQPGHWSYTGVSSAPWQWHDGHYVAVPPGAKAWVRGEWQQQGDGWAWREGHWAA